MSPTLRDNYFLDLKRAPRACRSGHVQALRVKPFAASVSSMYNILLPSPFSSDCDVLLLKTPIHQQLASV